MNDSFDTMLSRNASLIEAYNRMRAGNTHTKTDRHIMLCEKTLTDTQKAKREDIVTAMKDNSEDFKKKYGNDWESVMYASATKQALSEELMESTDESNSILMPTSVKHKRFEDDNIHSHSFGASDENVEAVHKHIKSLGFKQAGASDVYGSTSETKYTHPSGMTAYVGRNKRTGWLDVTNK